MSSASTIAKEWPRTRQALIPAAWFVLHLLVAVFATRMVESQLPFLLHLVDRRNLVLMEDCRGAAIALLSGYLAGLRWEPRIGKWTWVAGLSIFGWHALPALLHHDSLNIEFSGGACLSNPASSECSNWMLYTLPLVRTVFYSIGAYAASVRAEARPSNPALRKNDVPPEGDR